MNATNKVTNLNIIIKNYETNTLSFIFQGLFKFIIYCRYQSNLKMLETRSCMSRRRASRRGPLRLPLKVWSPAGLTTSPCKPCLTCSSPRRPPLNTERCRCGRGTWAWTPAGWRRHRSRSPGCRRWSSASSRSTKCRWRRAARGRGRAACPHSCAPVTSPRAPPLKDSSPAAITPSPLRLCQARSRRGRPLPT